MQWRRCQPMDVHGPVLCRSASRWPCTRCAPERRVSLEECGTTCQQEGVPLSLASLPMLEQLLAPLREASGERCLSDWNAGNLYLFRQAHDYRFHDGDFPHLTGRTYDHTAHVFPLFDLSKAPLSQVSELA